MKNEKNINICEQVKEIYTSLDAQIKSFDADCSACGKCCDFDSFGHKLFVSSPELLYFYENLKPLQKMSIGHCPYQQESKCTAREFRFAGCRIFFCKGDNEKQNALYEEVLRKFKSVCEQYSFPYLYMELSKALDFADKLDTTIESGQ
jgi:Fe-S-cluster containining protein